MFEHVAAVDAAIAEVARVLATGGRFCFFLNHPLLQTPGSGWIDDQVLDPPEQYWRIGPYLPEAATVEEVEPGVHIRFFHRPLSRYVNALAGARPARRADGGAGAAAGVPRPRPRVRSTPRRCPGCSISAPARCACVELASPPVTEIVLITGMSGAGRSATADVLEDLGWYVVDNLPTSLVEKVVELASLPGSGIDRLALVAGRNYGEVLDNVAALRSAGHRVTVLFLDAQTPELVRRYDATRRKHPLAAEADGLVESIDLERSLLVGTRDEADLVVDTSELNVHQLKERVVAAFGDTSTAKLQVAVESFGFKHGLPLDADIVMDVRFLPNPHWEDDLRPLTGHDPAVRDFVLEREDTKAFLDRLEDLLRTILPAYQAEGRSYLTVAIGCTGGRHRSVAIAEQLATRLRSRGTAVRTTHRDVSR